MKIKLNGKEKNTILQGAIMGDCIMFEELYKLYKVSHLKNQISELINMSWDEEKEIEYFEAKIKFFKDNFTKDLLDDLGDL